MRVIRLRDERPSPMKEPVFFKTLRPRVKRSICPPLFCPTQRTRFGSVARTKECLRDLRRKGRVKAGPSYSGSFQPRTSCALTARIALSRTSMKRACGNCACAGDPDLLQGDACSRKGISERTLSFLFLCWVSVIVLVIVGFYLKSNRTQDLTEHEPQLRSLPKRSPAGETEGSFAVHLLGAIPVQHIREDGKIGPWMPELQTPSSFLTLREGDTEAEVEKSGFYFVYAQIYYVTSEESNSFEIMTYREGEKREKHRMVATCSCRGPEHRERASGVHEVTCYTGRAMTLVAGDRLYLNQIEQNRVIYLNEGYSYFGIVKLSRG